MSMDEGSTSIAGSTLSAMCAPIELRGLGRRVGSMGVATQKSSEVQKDDAHPPRVVVVRVTESLCDFGALASVIRHTSEGVDIIVHCGTAELEEMDAAVKRLSKSHGRQVRVSDKPVFQTGQAHDVVLIDHHMHVGAEWDQRLASVAAALTTTGTVTALTNLPGDFMVETPNFSADIDDLHHEVDRATASVARRASLRRPIIPCAGAHAVLISRRLINVLNLDDTCLESLDGLIVDLSERASAVGFTHRVADDVLVINPSVRSEIGAVSSGPDPDPALPLARARLVASCAARGIAMIIDAENILGGGTGTLEVSIRLASALDAHPDVSKVIWTASAGREPAVSEVLARLSLEKTRFVPHSKVLSQPRPDIAFRPYQDFSGVEWPRLAAWARRNIIWILDLIVAQIPRYASTPQDYLQQVETIQLSLRNSDAIGALTKAVIADICSAATSNVGDKVFILPNGSPTSVATSSLGAVEPKVSRALDSPYIFVLGTDYPHKNMPWMVRLFERVVGLGWEGTLVFAGPGNLITTTLDDLPASKNALRERIKVLGWVEEDERDALMAHAELVVMPSLSEGWGMTPFEAVAAGSTPLASRSGGLADITPPEALSLSLRDDDADAKTVMSLLTNKRVADSQKQAWETARSTYSWAHSAEVLIDACFRSLDRAPAISRSQELRSTHDPLVPRPGLTNRLRERLSK